MGIVVEFLKELGCGGDGTHLNRDRPCRL